MSRVIKLKALIPGVAIFAAACISSRKNTFPEEALRATTTRLTWISPTLHGNQSESTFSEFKSSPQKTFAHYCAGGRPKHDWNLPIRAVTPRLPAGIPIDRASSINGELYKFFKQTISSELFKNERFVGGSDTGSKSTPVEMNSKIYTLASPEPNKLVQTLLNTRLENNLTAVLIGFEGKQELTLGMIRTRDFNLKTTEIQDGKKRLKVAEINNVNARGSAIAGVVWENRRIKDADGVSVWPIHPAGILEAALLPQHFTMLIPEAVQKEFFGQSHSDSGFFVRSDGTFDLTMAIRERQKLWNAYFTKAVRVDEAQTEEPSIIQFNIVLNLDIFCAYARPVEDLLTK